MRHTWGWICIVTLLMSGCAVVPREGVTPQKEVASDRQTYEVYPIGHIKLADGKTFIVVKPEFQDALMGLEGFPQINVLYWFDKNDTPRKRAILQVHPQGNEKNPMRGVFATRSPMRPNLIALSRCKVLDIRENVIELSSIDAFDKTPVLDIKPLIGPDRFPAK